MADNVKQIIRVIQTDLAGDLPLYHALHKIKGVGFSIANVICRSLNLEKTKKVGSLNPEEIKAIEGLIENPNFPSWLLNRQKDIGTGEDLHLTTAKLKLIKEFDVKRLQALKSYRGLRHAWGLPVRGQRTKSHFRKGRSVGVQKKSMKAQQQGDKKK